MTRPHCATCHKPLRRWRGGYGLEGRGRFCSIFCAAEWAQGDEAAADAANAHRPERDIFPIVQ